jgi:hypothetical protein
MKNKGGNMYSTVNQYGYQTLDRYVTRSALGQERRVRRGCVQAAGARHVM